MSVTEKADIYTLAQYGDLEDFKSKFDAQILNKPNENGSSLLHLAIAGSKFDIALFLIEKGIDVNLKNRDGQTALHLIAQIQDLVVAKSILDHGGDINVRDKYGNNAMWTAVFNCKDLLYDMVELFMKYSPDLDTKNKAGRSPVDFAKQVENFKLLGILGYV
jgi:uncharacterized protein